MLTPLVLGPHFKNHWAIYHSSVPLHIYTVPSPGMSFSSPTSSLVWLSLLFQNSHKNSSPSGSICSLQQTTSRHSLPTTKLYHKKKKSNTECLWYSNAKGGYLVEYTGSFVRIRKSILLWAGKLEKGGKSK